jgi:hypothetical protein
MHPDLSPKAIKTIETLCELGCKQVNQLISDANDGKEIEDLADFEASEVRMIIDELRQIMSVYDDR